MLIAIYTSSSFANDSCELDYTASSYLISESTSKIVVFDSASSCLGVFQNDMQRFIYFPKLKNIDDINPNTNFSMSKNSKYILMQFDEDEYEHTIRVYSLDNLNLIIETNASIGLWAENKLVLVPDYSIEDLPKPKGLRIFDPQSKLDTTIANNFAFTGKIFSGGNLVVGDVVINEDEVFTTKTLVINIKTGKRLSNFKFH